MAKIDVKGMNNSLVFVFSHGSAEELLVHLKEKLDSNPMLFRGSPIAFQGDALRFLSNDELITLQRTCLDYGMSFGSLAAVSPPAATVPGNAGQNSETTSDLITHRTLRSGQKLHSDGAIIIWGDVHESAEITAGGDVIVLGKLEGVAHAGCYGNNKCYVFALTLFPRQLRIGDRISRSSGDMKAPRTPEVAYIWDDNICIKEYAARDAMFR